jgi:hypothetical protein
MLMLDSWQKHIRSSYLGALTNISFEGFVAKELRMHWTAAYAQAGYIMQTF